MSNQIIHKKFEGGRLETYVIKPFDPSNRKAVEKIFNVGLKGRHWSIKVDESQVEIIFHDHDNCFGYLERRSVTDFFAKLHSMNLYLDIGGKGI